MKKNLRDILTLTAAGAAATTLVGGFTDIEAVDHGENVAAYVTNLESGVELEGTGLATAYASGHAALLMSMYPDKGPEEIKDMMIQETHLDGIVADKYVTDDNMTIAAPGMDLYTPGNIIDTGICVEDTGFAAPHVAGTAAKFLQEDPDLSIEDLKTKLEKHYE